eukprot:gene2837-3095_t
MSGPNGELTQSLLDSLNVEQAREDNRKHLDELGGVEILAKIIGVNLITGWSHDDVLAMRQRFGTNAFPESPMESYFTLLLRALSDGILLILIAASTVSLIIGVLTHPEDGWIEAVAIFIAIFLVSNITAGNDYSKQLQFRALEASSQNDERASVLRNGSIERVNPKDIVVGDIVVLQAGDSIPADCILIDKSTVLSNESSLTGEPEDIKKTRDKDCFLLSSCLITEGEDCKALVIGIGTRSQWGKIKANLVSEAVNTPLQDKLEDMAKWIGKVGVVFAVATFIALVVSIWARHDGKDVVDGFVKAFIIAVTIVVVSIPEGLPLAVTLALAYSTKKMYQDQCFIRVLAACETMGNATNICSDKTGTLTENRMTVVEGWFADNIVNQEEFPKVTLTDNVKSLIAEQVAINRSAYLIHKDADGRLLDRPQIIGNKTEGALVMMIRSWGFDYEQVKETKYNQDIDRIYNFNSAKKRSTAVVHQSDGTVRIFCKGASEWILKDCTHYLLPTGKTASLTPEKRDQLEEHILSMAGNALRTLCLAHRDFESAESLPNGWEDNPPDNSRLILDCIVGIIDPLRSDVKEAVRMAQEAGVTVRMVTGDNIATACAIARQCGILTPTGLAVEGPTFRRMKPKDVDAILPRLQVLARSSPDDKYLLVTRLNGHGIPSDREEWVKKFKDREGVTWEKDRDLLLPGYREEWEESRPEVFISAIAGFEVPLNAVQLLWVNLVMDTMGALALGMEEPTPELLQRKPYKRTASLISWPMYRNIIFQAFFQLLLLLLLLFQGAKWFDVSKGIGCLDYKVESYNQRWDLGNREISPWGTFACNDFKTYCDGEGLECLEEQRVLMGNGTAYHLAMSDLEDFDSKCLECKKEDYTHNTIIFNTFIFCQVFNEYNARSIFDEWNAFKNIQHNPIFIFITLITIGFQIILVNFGGDFLKTTPLSIEQWLITVALGAISLPMGVFMRVFPIAEDPNSFFDNNSNGTAGTSETGDNVPPHKIYPEVKSVGSIAMV